MTCVSGDGEDSVSGSGYGCVDYSVGMVTRVGGVPNCRKRMVIMESNGGGDLAGGRLCC